MTASTPWCDLEPNTFIEVRTPVTSADTCPDVSDEASASAMALGPSNPYVGGFPATSFGECGNHPAYQAGGESPFASLEVFCDANHRISYKGYSGEACSGDMTHTTVEMVYNHPSGECSMEESEECGGHDASGANLSLPLSASDDVLDTRFLPLLRSHLTRILLPRIHQLR